MSHDHRSPDGAHTSDRVAQLQEALQLEHDLLALADQEITQLKESLHALEARVLAGVEESDSDKLKNLGALYSRLRAEFDRLKAVPAPVSPKELADRDRQIETLRAERNALADQLVVLGQEAQTLERRVTETDRQRREAERALQAHQKDIESFKERQSKLERDLRTQTGQREASDRALTVTKQESDRLKRDMKTLESQSIADKRRIEGFEKQVSELRHTLEQRNVAHQHEQQQRETLLNQLAEVERERRRLEQRCNTLMQDALDAQQLADEAGNDQARLLAEIKMLREAPLPMDFARDYLQEFERVKQALGGLTGHAQKIEHLLQAPAPQPSNPPQEVPLIKAALDSLTRELEPLNTIRDEIEEPYQDCFALTRQYNIDLKTVAPGSEAHTRLWNAYHLAQAELTPLKERREIVLQTIDALHGRIQLLRHRLEAHKLLEQPLDTLLASPKPVTIPPPVVVPPVNIVAPAVVVPLTAPAVQETPPEPLTLEDLEGRLREKAQLHSRSVIALVAVTLCKELRQKSQARPLTVTVAETFQAAIEVGILDRSFAIPSFEKIEAELQSLRIYVTKTMVGGKACFTFLPNKHLAWKTFVTPEQAKALLARLRTQG